MTSSEGNGASLAVIARQGIDAAADRRTKQGYLRWLPARGRVLDVGCGSGAFLDAARERGLAAVGIDGDAGAFHAARGRGHDVRHGELFALLADFAARGERFDGAVLAHVIEHFDGARAHALLAAITAVLAPGARLVIATPNVRSHIVLGELFWLDATHVRPYPRALLERMGVALGCDVIASYDDVTTRPRRPWWRAAIARLRSWLSGVDKCAPLDAVVVLQRRG